MQKYVPRYSFSPYILSEWVVNLSGVAINLQLVSHESISQRSSSGKSLPVCTVQLTCFDVGGSLNNRAPNAEYAPAPPMISMTGVFGTGKYMSSLRSLAEPRPYKTWWHMNSVRHTNNEHPKRAEVHRIGFQMLELIFM